MTVIRVTITKRAAMKGFVQDIDVLAIKNEEFRRVLYTAKWTAYRTAA